MNCFNLSFFFFFFFCKSFESEEGFGITADLKFGNPVFLKFRFRFILLFRLMQH